MADGSTLNLKDTHVRLTTSSEPAIKGQSWWKAEVVNVNHSRLEAYSPTYTTDQISDLNLILQPLRRSGLAVGRQRAGQADLQGQHLDQ